MLRSISRVPPTRSQSTLRAVLPCVAPPLSSISPYSVSSSLAADVVTASAAAPAPPSEIPQGWKGVKRFYDNVGVRALDADGAETSLVDGETFAVLIEGRELRTNGMNDLRLPSLELALAISAEFANQGQMIHPPSTPLYNLSCLALDAFAQDGYVVKPFTEDEKVTETEILRDELFDNLETDSTVYRVALNPLDPGEVLLRRRQEKYYDPLVKWYEANYGGPLHIVEGLAEATHPKCAYEPLQQYVNTADPWLKAATRQALGTLKSTVVTMAFLSRHINVDQAFEACRVEEEFQIEEHGFVEDGHDTGRANTRVKLSSVASFLWMLPKSNVVLPEAPLLADAPPSTS